MNFNFSELKAHTKKNERQGSRAGRKGQSYTGIKYKVSKTGVPTFTMANSTWDELGMDSNSIINFPPNNGQVVIAVVPETHEKALLWGKAKESNGKPSEKSKTIRASILENNLKEVGVLNEVNQDTIVDRKPVMQFVSLEKVDQDIPQEFSDVYGTELYVLSAGTTEDNSDNSDDEDEEEEVVSEASQDEAPQTASIEDEDDF